MHLFLNLLAFSSHQMDAFRDGLSEISMKARIISVADWNLLILMD